MTRNFELRAISYNASLSEETNCYSAKLFLDGKHIADVGNRGHGGCDEQRPVGGFDLMALDKEIRSTYPRKPYGHGMDGDYEQDIESICGDLLTQWLVVRDVKRIFKKGIAFVVPGEKGGLRTMKYKVAMTPAMKEKVIASCRAKYPTAIILNDLTDAEIYQRACEAE